VELLLAAKISDCALWRRKFLALAVFLTVPARLSPLSACRRRSTPEPCSWLQWCQG